MTTKRILYIIDQSGSKCGLFEIINLDVFYKNSGEAGCISVLFFPRIPVTPQLYVHMDIFRTLLVSPGVRIATRSRIRFNGCRSKFANYANSH